VELEQAKQVGLENNKTRKTVENKNKIF